MAPEYGSWGEMVAAYRSDRGSRSLSTVEQLGAPAVRYTRSTAAVCPLAETTHPLYAVGCSPGGHSVNTADGSYQRSQWHGWGDVSLLKSDGYEGQTHPRGLPLRAEGKRALPAPGDAGGRGLFGVLQGSEAGGPDGWIGHLAIDPSKGRRSVPAPTDGKRTAPLAEILAHTAPGDPGADAFIGNPSIDPAKGRGHAPDPSSLRGRPDLFGVLQQRALKQWQEGGGGGRPSAAEADAWLGNRMLQPNKGRKQVEVGSCESLFASTFRGGPPADGCWSDLPHVGKRPLRPRSGFVTAAQTLRMEEPLPPGTVVGPARPQGKGLVPASASASNPQRVDLYRLLHFQPMDEHEAQRSSLAWNDAARQPRRKAVQSAAAAQAQQAQAQLNSPQPCRPVRFVRPGGLAQEVGSTLDQVVRSRPGAGASAAGNSQRGSRGGSGGGRGAANAQRLARSG